MFDRIHGDICPECGKSYDTRRVVPRINKKSRNAIIWLSIAIITMPFIGLLSFLPLVLGGLASHQILRNTTYNRVPFHIKKRLKAISILMWVYGISFLSIQLIYILTNF